MSRHTSANLSDSQKKDKVYSTKTLYLDAKQKAKLFITSTYNYEGSSGEEFLIRIRKWDDSESDKNINRLVFVSGDEPHVPIYRSRLHTNNAGSEIYLSNFLHGGSRVLYTTYGDNENVAVTRLSRAQLVDAEVRGYNPRGEIAEELSVFGLKLVDKIKKGPSTKQRRDDLPIVKTVISKEVSGDVHRTSTKVRNSDSPKASTSDIIKKRKEKDQHAKNIFLRSKVIDGIRILTPSSQHTCYVSKNFTVLRFNFVHYGG